LPTAERATFNEVAAMVPMSSALSNCPALERASGGDDGHPAGIHQHDRPAVARLERLLVLGRLGRLPHLYRHRAVGLFNGLEAAVNAPLALRVAVSVVPSLGARRGRPAGADPFAEPADGQAAAPGGAGRPPHDGGAAEPGAGPAAGQATAVLDPEPRPTEGGLP
jgi:hypothetical protein